MCLEAWRGIDPEEKCTLLIHSNGMKTLSSIQWMIDPVSSCWFLSWRCCLLWLVTSTYVPQAAIRATSSPGRSWRGWACSPARTRTRTISTGTRTWRTTAPRSCPPNSTSPSGTWTDTWSSTSKGTTWSRSCTSRRPGAPLSGGTWWGIFAWSSRATASRARRSAHVTGRAETSPGSSPASPRAGAAGCTRTGPSWRTVCPSLWIRRRPRGTRGTGCVCVCVCACVCVCVCMCACVVCGPGISHME